MLSTCGLCKSSSSLSAIPPSFLSSSLSFIFFAFAEKYIEDKGFCPDSAFHFEIVDGKIDIDKLNSGEEIILVADKKFIQDGIVEICRKMC